MTVLARTPSAVDTRELTALARRLASAVRGDEVTIGPGEERGYVRLLETPTHEAWLIAWARTSGLDLHDHGGSAGAIHVVRGRLREDYTDLVTFDRAALAPGGPSPYRRRGRTRSQPRSRSGPQRPRVLPAGTSMTFYDRGPKRFLEQLRTKQ